LRYGFVEADPSVPEEPLLTIRALASDVSERRRPLPPLIVRKAIFKMIPFATDRGIETLPGWELEADDARGPFWVLATATLEKCWSPPPAHEGELCGLAMLESATAGDTNKVLRVEFVGSPSHLVRYEAAVYESQTAVTVVPVERSDLDIPEGVAILAVGMMRSVGASLANELGPRVFVGLNGLPLPVSGLSESPSPVEDSLTRHSDTNAD